MHNVVLSQIDPELLISSIADKVTANILNAVGHHANESDQWFDLKDLCTYLPDKPSKATVYGWVHNGIIPNHKGGKKLRFLKSEIDTWLKQGRRKTLSELATEADNLLSKKKGSKA